MLLALVLAAAPVTISLTADTVSVDGQVVQAVFDDGSLNLPAVEKALRSKRTDAGTLDVRIDVVGGVPFLRLKKALFSSAAAGARTLEVRFDGGEPFENVIGPSLGVIRVTPAGVWVEELRLRSDGGVVDGVQLKERLPAPRPDSVVNIAVDDSILCSTLAPLVETCRRGGYQVAFMPLSVGSSAAGATVMGSIDKESIRDVIKANRKVVGACYEKVLLKKPNASGKVMVRFVISAAGDVAVATVEENELGSDELAQCLTKVVKKWVFPKPAGGGVVVIKYPFVFSSK